MSEPQASFGFREVDPADKPGLVRGVFDRVAPRYDLMNDLMSVGVHRIWKDMTAARLNPQPGELIVDCAGGTGDISRRLAKMARRAKARRGGADARIMVVDFDAEMVAAGAVDDQLARLGVQPRSRHVLPHPVHPGGHQVVHQVVAAGHPVEHAADQARFFRRVHLTKAEAGLGLVHRCAS